ncbi:MAG: ParA family protein [Clostridia bacterium]|nr:ParA family protein [Clostridia bacterium]
MKKGKTIAICNQKGGSAKTTTTFNLSFALAEKGKKVLVIDADPQGNLTMCFGVDTPEDLPITLYHLIIAVMEDRKLPDKSEYIISKGNIDLIPCSIELSAVEGNLINATSKKSILRSAILRSVIDEIKADYDYIIIDNMPSLGMLTINALTACDSVLITTTPEYLSAKGLELLLRTIIRVKKKLNPKIVIDGILLTMFKKRTIISREIASLIKETYGDTLRIYDSKIPSSVKVGEANYYNKTIIEYKPDNKVALAYKRFGEEYLSYE